VNAKHLVVFSLLMALCSAPVIAEQESTYSAAKVRDAMVSALASIEDAAGLEPAASQAMSGLDDEVVETLFSSMANKEEFITSAQQTVDRIQSARAGLAEGQAGIPKRPLRSLESLAGTPPFPPNYPSGVSYEVILLLGLVDSPDDRCGGPGFEAYEAVLAGAEAALAIGDAACSVAGCDPTGIVCVSVCGAVEAVKLAVLTARIPIDACASHGRGVDSAEIEAGYENGLSTLSDLAAHDANINGDLAAHDANIDGDLAAHDANIDGDLAAHDANIDGDLAAHDARITDQLSTHDSDIKALLADIVANQEEIIKLLKTPQGRRPGWGVDGY